MSDSAPVTDKFPIGHVFDVIYPEIVPRITIDSETELSFVVLDGISAGLTETVQYEVINIRPGVFYVSWQEKSKLTVVHVEDFEQGMVYAICTLPDGTFMRMNGKIQPVE